MRKIVVAALMVSLVLPASSGAAFSPASGADEPESCQAYNPGQPKCTYTVTHSTDSPVTGVAGVGTWIVKIKRGKKTITVKSPYTGEPTAIEIQFRPKDKVTAVAATPGSALVVGHAD
jgi:hypothetical protein